MDFERGLYSPKPEDVLTEDEYQILQRSQQGELPCPGCETTLNGSFYFDIVKGRQTNFTLSCQVWFQITAKGETQLETTQSSAARASASAWAR